ncbi:PEP-CTERM sorting domain-containing protein [Neiella sp. HB171785]|uniref:PEP-CTERM sorting domain-containing protein n=1 Tax=Neiella litorisoli TaxID=2771431 RepID=A0A8J6QTA5_9GAMM|nr:PEP-CTERM sorting domain-containing protein [Neiella litorisoli]MBD1390514.1 PEP-CTERM sorting domain-containing protein [Neiella litorisoli]
MIRILLLIIAVPASFSTSAALIPSVFSQFSGVLDDRDDGLEWLSLTYTEGQSYHSVVEQTAAGQLFEGWRVASTTEFNDMLMGLDYRISAPEQRFALLTSSSFGRVSPELLVNLFGDTWEYFIRRDSRYDLLLEQVNTMYSLGFLSDSSDDGQQYFARIQNGTYSFTDASSGSRYSNSGQSTYISNAEIANPFYGKDSVGTFLVRDKQLIQPMRLATKESIPEPTTIFMFILGFGVLYIIRQKRSTDSYREMG